VAPERLLHRAGLPADLLTRSSMLSAAQYFGLWQALQDECGDPALPLRVGRHISVEAFDPLVFAAFCSPDLHVAAERIARYKRLIGPMRLVVSRGGGRTTIACRWPPLGEPPASLGAAELVFWVALTRLATRSDIQPVEITMPTLPEPAAAYRDYFGTPPSAGPGYSVTFADRDAGRPFLSANDVMWEFFEPELRQRLADLEVDATMTDRVRAALLELLPLGRTTVPAVAHNLTVSVRTLQRRLREEDTTFQAVLTATRESLARHYLRQGHLRSAEIAFLIGYEEPSSFHRAFHSWTGQTPEKARPSRV
jgi:AraC-like DNA-binding protein